MRATAIEFRLRVLIMVLIVALGAWSPWIASLGSGRRISLLEWMSLELSRLGVVSFTVATPLVIVLASLVAALGAILRIWGSAWLGADIVHHASMNAGALVADGPFRYVRNPLYLGSICMVAAVACVLPPSGALLVGALLIVFLFRLILAEEAFLSTQLGPAYHDYQRAVPRLIPRLRTSLPSSGQMPHWGAAVLSELFPIGVFVTLATLSWRYDNQLLIKAILVSFGISLVARALIPGTKDAPAVAP